MKNIAFIGSCLSASIAKALSDLDDSCRLIAGLSHTRSDVFIDLFINKALERPDTEELKRIMLASGRSGYEANNILRARGQSAKANQNFIKKIFEADIIIIDTNYEIATTLFDVRYEGGILSRVSFVPELRNISQNIHIQRIKKLLPEIVADNMRIIVRWLKSNAPKAKVYLVNFPASGFRRVGAHERVERTVAVARTVSTIKEAHIFPMLEIPRNHQSERGAHYFSENVYQFYARSILNSYKDGAEVPTQYPGGEPVTEFRPKQHSLGESSPYDNLSERNYWKPAVADRYPLGIKDLYTGKFTIGPNDKVATCGSCFAQHIGKRLKKEGFSFIDVEPAPDTLPRSEWANNGFGIFSARYGNVYTARQLLQLFDQAYGVSQPEDKVWEAKGRFYDPYRPNIQPNGFTTAEEVLEARQQHLAAVRQLFDNVNVFIFTLGLTEAWRSRGDGYVYPLCPGVSVGTFDLDQHEFVNFGYNDVYNDVRKFFRRLKRVNPSVRMILTVSPVPLTATAEDRHVIVSTTYSKSVLRAAAGALAAENPDIDYFPSYEIITAPNFRGMFYKPNLRNIHDEGVDFVMSHFFAHHKPARSAAMDTEDESEGDEFCDEVLLAAEKRMVAAD